MKKIFFLLIALVFIPSAYISAQLSNSGLVAHWDFNGNVMDQSGNGHHGNANNITYTIGSQGQANTAAKFQSSNASYVSIPNSNDFNINQYTIAAKVKADSFYLGVCQNSVIIQRGEAHTNGHFGLLLSDSYYDSSCTITGDTSHFYFGASSGDNNRSMSFKHYQAPNPVSTNRWYCVVATYDSLASRLYIDGQLVATVRPRNAVKPISTSNDSVVIGMSRFGNFGTFPYYLNGSIDDIMLYNRPFTPTEVSNYCNASAPNDTMVTLNPVPSTLCLIDSVYKFDYTVNKNFNPGNVFSLELSDPTGSFATPLVLGSVTSVTDGTISCILPTSLQPGNGYLLRIVATDPVRTYVTPQPVTIANASVPQVTITTPPMPIMPNTTVVFTANATNAGANAIYIWRQNSQIISSSVSSSLQMNTNQLQHKDSITVQVVVTEGCSQGVATSSSPVILWMSASSISNINGATFSCYPNPTSGVLLLKGTVSTDATYGISVLNVLGQKVYTGSVASQQGSVNKSIDLSGLPAGTYMMQISSDNGKAGIRIVIE